MLRFFWLNSGSRSFNRDVLNWLLIRNIVISDSFCFFAFFLNNIRTAFWLVDLRTSYQWNKWLQTYIGINNVFDYQQAKKDSFLWLDKDGNLDVTHIWGPNIGRTVVAGVKLSF